MPRALRLLFHPLVLILAASPAIAAFVLHVDSPTAPTAPSTVEAQQAGVTRLRSRQATFVSRSTPQKNHGRDGMIWVDGDPQKRGLLRFNVRAVPRDARITSATLRLYATNYSATAGTIHRAGGRWMTRTVTWNSAPPLGNRISSLRDPARVETWRTAPVGQAVRTARAGNGLLNLYITSSDGDGVFYARGAARGPQLIVRWTRNVTTTPTPKPTKTATTSPTPTPTKTPDPEYTIIAAGDIAQCDNEGDEQTAAIVKGIAGTVATLGDTVYETGAEEEFRDCYNPSWGQFKSRTRPVVGNHEYLTEDADPYFDYFGSLAGDRGKGWYAYDQGGWRVYALNSNCGHLDDGCGPGSEQYEWLRAQLAQHPRDCILAYWHHPLFSDGPHGDNEGGGAEHFWRLLYDAGAELVLVGHDHHYQRWAPQDADGKKDARGIREFVVGTGGKGTNEGTRTPSNLELTNSDSLGVLELRLKLDGYSWQFRAVPGAPLSDSGSESCH